MNHIRKVITVIALIVIMQCSMAVRAADAACIVETFTGEDSVSVYVKGASEEIGDTSVQIGTSTGTVASVKPITEQDVPMKTLVMIDNSVSIKQEDRRKIADFLQNLISDRDSGEEIAITTFSEDIVWLTEYTSDYSTLKRAVDEVEYRDQETYLTDVLYDLITDELLADREDIYHRIIIVSDGVDNKSLGYTKEELYSLLKENPYSIYTIGCANNKNDEELENMFALSRLTSAESYLLGEMENTLDITDSLKEDRNIVKVEIIPSQEVMDGSRKVVKLSLNGGSGAADISADVIMPQKTKVADEKPEPEPEKEEVPKAPVEPETPVPEETGQNGMRMAVLIVLFCLVVIAAVVVVIIIRLLTKGKKDRTRFEAIDDNVLNQLEVGPNLTEKTELVMQDVPEDGENTYCIWNNRNTYHVVLTDVHSTVKSFQTPLEGNIIIGRKQGICNIVLDYDKSVSNRHCEISVRDGKFYIKDLQSSNGTFVNGSRVVTEIEIFSGNIIKLGRLEMKFEVR